MPPRFECEVSESVMRSLRRQSKDSGEDLGILVDRLLAEALDLERHSLFQISTSNALVEGVFSGSITVGHLLAHGDFGLGTFAGLDGEMIIIDGQCFRASAQGSLTVADEARTVPFAVITRFAEDISLGIDDVPTIEALRSRLDSLRPSENLFVAIKVEGTFDTLSMRAACKAAEGESLLEATSHQSEFSVSSMAGSLVGFWAPEYTTAVSVPGYHFHFISDDRTVGGHVGKCQRQQYSRNQKGRCEDHPATEDTPIT